MSVYDGMHSRPSESIVTLYATSGRGPGPGQGVPGSMIVETTCWGRSWESVLCTSTWWARPRLRALNHGMWTGREARIVPGGVAGSTRGGDEYQGSGEGLGRYRSGVRSCSGTGRSAADMRPDEARALTWTTAPLAVATEVTGYPRVSLWASCDRPDGDMVFSLDDVAPDGTSTQVVQGYLNVPHGASEAEPAPLVPGQARRIALDLLPTAMVFQPGHRIRLALAGAATAAPGLPNPQGPGPNPAAFTWTVLQDGAHPATLTLPIVGTAGDQLARPGTGP